MKYAVIASRILLGLIFAVFGANGFLHFIPTPPPPGLGGQFMTALYLSHELFVIMAVELVGGVLLLINLYVPAALLLLAPIVINILLFHAFMAPGGLPLALLTTTLWIIAVLGVRSVFTPIFQRRVIDASWR